MRIKISVLALLLGGVLTGCRTSGETPYGSANDDNSPIILTINGQPERQSGFERFIKARLADFAAQDGQNRSNYDQIRSQLLDSYILRQLIVREAEVKKIMPTDEEIRQEMETQHKLASAINASVISRSMDDGKSEKNNNENGDSEKINKNLASLEGNERRIEIYYDLVMRKFYEQAVKGDVKVTPAEVEAYYNSNLDKYQGKGGFYVREIRVHEQDEAMKLQRQALAKPRDFAVLAREHSEAPTAENGGLIYYEANQLPPFMEKPITQLKVGSISNVVQSNYGFHIFKLEQRAEPLPFEKVKKEIEEKLVSEKNVALIDEYNRRAFAGAQIQIYRDRLGFNYVGSLAGL
ncbi:MAG: peptidyl-prolyl cis-trans isomerase [Blastocatellia bacterium]|nr:peptidyl-prolyl cis-trans isomerase [Blastocatellia bacterium]